MVNDSAKNTHILKSFKSLLWDYFRYDVYWYLFIFISAILYWRLGPSFWSCVWKINHVSHVMKCINDLLLDDWVNAILWGGLIIAFVFLYYKYLLDRHASVLRICTVCFLLEILRLHNIFDYCNIVGTIDYKTLFSAFCWLVIVLEVIKLCCNIRKYFYDIKESELNQKSGFIVDSCSQNQTNDRRKKMSDILVKRMLDADLSKECFAIGIIGDWGTGKTLLLDHIKGNLGNKAFIVNFCPWDCQDAKSIVPDFFNHLRASLSPYYSPLEKPIIKYTKLLEGLEYNVFQKWIIGLFSIIDLGDSKSILSKYLSKLECPVVVFVDDLDRLGKDESFEVLRMIRNTANLPNLIFIAAYDRTYLAKSLQSKGISNSEQYIEKIFQLEMAMPQAGDYEIVEQLLNDLRAMLKDREQIVDWFQKRLNYNDIDVLASALGGYRQAHQLARLLVAHIEMLSGKNVKCERNLIDVLWLCVLQISDIDTYKELYETPLQFLYIDNDRYQLKEMERQDPDQVTDRNKVYTGRVLKKATILVLDKLFKNNVLNKLSMCMRNNFEQFFYMGVEKNKLSYTETVNLFSDEAGIDEKMKKICKEKTSSSILHQLKYQNIGSTLEERKKSLLVFTQWIFCQTYSLMTSLAPVYFAKGRLSNEDSEQLKNWLMDRINTQIESAVTGESLYQLVFVMKDLYIPTFGDGSFVVNREQLIDNLHIEEIIQKSIQKFLDIQKPDLTDLVHANSLFYKIYNASIINVVVSEYEEEEYSTCFGKNIVIEYYSKNKCKNKQEFKEYFEVTQDDEQYGYLDEIEYDKDEKIRRFFGTKDNYDALLQNCFM